MKHLMLAVAAAALLAVAAPALAEDLPAHALPAGCKNLIADARACIPKGTTEDVKTRINHVLDMMADNVRHSEPAQQMELCMTTITSYRQMADLVCVP